MSARDAMRDYLNVLNMKLQEKEAIKRNTHINTIGFFDFISRDIITAEKYIDINPIAVIGYENLTTELCVCNKCVAAIRRFCNMYYNDDVRTDYIQATLEEKSIDGVIWKSFDPYYRLQEKIADITDQINNYRECERCGQWDEICICDQSDDESDHNDLSSFLSDTIEGIPGIHTEDLVAYCYR